MTAHQEGEEQLVLLEERAADVAVHRVRVLRDQVAQPRLEVCRRLGVVDRAVEDLLDVPRERVLVHRVDVRHVGDAEEEDRRAVRRRLVAFARVSSISLRSSPRRPPASARSRSRPSWPRAARISIAFWSSRMLPSTLGERLEDLVLDLLELALVLRRLEDQLRLLLLELGPLLGDDDAEQLVLEALGGDHEVEQRHLHRHLGQVVRVAQLRRDVELEVLVVLDVESPSGSRARRRS